jgi:hypothetical protein
MGRRAIGGAVRAQTLERLLANNSEGLSANAIAKQADAGYAPTLRLLHELEAAGQVRRSGSRRSTVWRLITGEERIAQRAAGPGQRIVADAIVSCAAGRAAEAIVAMASANCRRLRRR